MAVKDVESKCWILALFVRDDGERFLLGDGKYEFTEEQMHFAANVMANDVVEVQGNDGYMLAGQVRRPDTQSFDGYIGDSSTSKTEVEACRQAFFKFFRKNFFYKVIYIFSDGSAIQRKRGFLVDAPVAQELYQIYPKYHVALNFEDINYYYYDENADGDEIYGKSATISLNSTEQTGGLVWALPETITLSGEGKEITLNGTQSNGKVTAIQPKGDTQQNGIPSPDSPVEVQTVTGEQTVEIRGGKNLWDLSVAPTVNNLTVNVTYDQTTNTLSVPSDSSTTSGSRYSGFTLNNLTPGQTYTMSIGSFSNDGIPSGNRCMLIRSYDGTSYTELLILRPSSLSGTFTIPSDSKSLDIWVYTVQGYTSLFTEVQLESGSTATSYQPYQGKDYEINLGKNLLKNQADNKEQNGISMVVNKSGSITVNGTSTGIAFVVPQTQQQSRIFPAGTYTLTMSQMPSGGAIIVETYDSQDLNTRIDYFGGKQGEGTVTFTTTRNLLFRISTVFCYNSDAVFNNQTFVVQLEKGPVATDYASYFEPIELGGINDFQDRIYKNDGKWYLYKMFGKVVCDGTETDWSTSVDSGLRQFYRALPDAGTTDPARQVARCNRFIRNASANNFFVSGNNLLVFRQPQSQGTLVANTVEEWKTWLASNNTTVYYALATPTTTQITNEALVEQLETLLAAKTYDGQTIFTVDGNGNLAATLAVEVQAESGGGVVWDDDGAEWENGKAPYSVISIDSIDNVYPVVRISGRTVNPILTDVSTGTIFQYNGTITDSQVLVIDMMNKTATLNGTSVIGNVTGDWLYLAPGANRITYTADNATAPNATLEWQEIVG